MNSLYRPEVIGIMVLQTAQMQGQPFTISKSYEDIGTGDVRVQLISERSAKGWSGRIPLEWRSLDVPEFVAKLREQDPVTFGQPVDPKEEKRAQIQLLTRKIAESGAQIAQQVADLTKLIAELE